VTDEGLKELFPLTTLEGIILDETEVTGAGADELRRALPHTDVRYLKP
jgi:hypothetical protein